jgi:mannose-1-phosphate guanylyltransferase
LLLAAGLGTRLRPITDTIPKCLVPIHGRPLLGYWLDRLLEHGVSRVLLNTHYLPERVREFVAQSKWRDRIDLVHEASLLGTGGTVLANRAYFGRESFLVGHADNLTRFDVAEFIACHRARSAHVAMTMMTFDTDAPSTCGIVVSDSSGVVREFHEKVANPPGTRANAAVYIFESEVVDFIASLGKPVVDLSTEVLPRFLGRIGTYHNTGYHRDIGSPESLAAAHREFSD